MVIMKIPLKIHFDVGDALIIIGGGMVGIGLWLIYPPASLIILGAAITWLGIGAGRIGGRR